MQAGCPQGYVGFWGLEIYLASCEYGMEEWKRDTIAMT